MRIRLAPFVVIGIAAAALATMTTLGDGRLLGLAWAQAAKGPVNVDVGGVAMKGHDPVAYFKDGRAVEGQSTITATHDQATYRFATTANRDAFIANPAAYLPQYGGYCAFGVASGYKVDVDPKVWRVVDGKLYLNFNRSVGERWSADIPGYVKKADDAWPGLR